MSDNSGYQIPTDYGRITQDFLAKFASQRDNYYLREIDRRWRKIGKLAEAGRL